MPDEANPKIEVVCVTDSTGKTSSMDDMTNWLLSVLSGGNVGAYALDVLKRAEETTTATA